MASPKMMMSKDRRPLTTNFCLDHIPLADDRLIINQITGIKSQRARKIGLFREKSIYRMPWGAGIMECWNTGFGGTISILI